MLLHGVETPIELSRFLSETALERNRYYPICQSLLLLADSKAPRQRQRWETKKPSAVHACSLQRSNRVPGQRDAPDGVLFRLQQRPSELRRNLLVTITFSKAGALPSGCPPYAGVTGDPPFTKNRPCGYRSSWVYDNSAERTSTTSAILAAAREAGPRRKSLQKRRARKKQPARSLPAGRNAQTQSANARTEELLRPKAEIVPRAMQLNLTAPRS